MGWGPATPAARPAQLIREDSQPGRSLQWFFHRWGWCGTETGVSAPPGGRGIRFRKTLSPWRAKLLAARSSDHPGPPAAARRALPPSGPQPPLPRRRPGVITAEVTHRRGARRSGDAELSSSAEDRSLDAIHGDGGAWLWRPGAGGGSSAGRGCPPWLNVRPRGCAPSVVRARIRGGIGRE